MSNSEKAFKAMQDLSEGKITPKEAKAIAKEIDTIQKIEDAMLANAKRLLAAQKTGDLAAVNECRKEADRLREELARTNADKQ